MTVAIVGQTGLNNSTGTTTPTWQTPVSTLQIVAGYIWILSVSCRAGSAVTISGVPASFNLIGRVDQGSGATVNTIISYWYLCLGTESTAVTLGTITLSASSKWVTQTAVFSGVNTTAPVVAGSIRTATAAGLATVTPAAFAAGQMCFGFGGEQGSTTLPTFVGTNSSLVNNDVTTGGAVATNVGDAGGTASTSGGTGWGLSGGAPSTGCVQTFTLDLPPEDSPALELSSFGTFTGVRSGDTINSLTVAINQFGSSGMSAPTYQLWDGTTAQIGTTRTGTASTSTTNVDTLTFTGVTYSQLATLRLRIFAHGSSGMVLSVDSVWMQVNYSPVSGPSYATSSTGLSGGTGSWVNPTNADGAPDGAYASWTAP